ncbi:MAG: M23 family metallopeptidase, partial [Thermomicrobiales bacterium]
MVRNEEERDPGDGPVAKRDQRPEDKEPKSDRADLPSRIWPMPEESYAFTQHFGCVPQLGNLYFPGDGCPASTPVIHTGVDLAAPEGTLFYAAASGWVTLADYDRPTPDANTRIIIQHDGRNEGYATDYLHWIATYVEAGDYVYAGDPIGEVGSVGYSTGPHLHFSVTDLATGEHVDPVRWLPKGSGPSEYPR